MRGTLFTIGLLSLGLSSCGGKDAEPETLTFATYNAGLAVVFVPTAEERAPVVAKAIAEIDADVVCLNEIWRPDHVALVEAAVKGTFDHTWFPDASQVEFTSPACSSEDLDPLADCMATECQVCDDELVDCLFSSCPIEFISLPKDCSRCAQANVDTADADVVRTNCTTGGQEYAYGGSYGTGLISKYPLKAVEHIVLDSTTNRRGLIHATIEAPGGDIDAWCTHLTAGLGAIPYPRAEGTWEEEQYAQAERLATLLADAPEPVVLMGDLNNGPTTANAVEEFPANYQLFLDAGMDVPYVELDGRCTFCSDNGLSSADSDEDNRVIDHVMFRGFDKAISAERLLDQPLDTELCGAAITANYSDHYGVSVTVPFGADAE